MNKTISVILSLLICVSVFGVYTAPNEDTIVAVGGLGTQANNAQLNGGGATKAAWNAGSPSDFINTNGGPKRTASCAFTTASKNLNGTDIGNGVTVGTLCFVSTGDGAHITAGVYEITTVTDNDNIVCAQIDDDGTNDINVTVNVGGAIDTLQNVFDNTVNNGASFNRYIYYNGNETVSATVDIDAFSGSITTRIFLIGYNATLAAEELEAITTTTDLSGNGNGLIKFDGTQDYFEFWSIDFNGGGKDATRAVYCVEDAGAGSLYVVYEDCKFHGAVSHGVHQNSNEHYYINCEFYLNGGTGLTEEANRGIDNRFYVCSFHDNDSHGMLIHGSRNFVSGCLFYDNGKDGTGHGLSLNTGGDVVVIVGNTSFGNATDGFDISALADRNVIVNNAAIGNGANGYDFNGQSIRNTSFFGYNLAGANTTAHYSEGADNTFAAFRHGNNVASAQTADQLLETITDGSEDLTPETGSDLIDAGLGRVN